MILVGTPMISVGVPTLFISEPMILVGTPMISVGVPTLFIGEPMVLIGAPMVFVGAPTFFIGEPMVFVGEPTFFVGSPTLFIGEPTILIGSPTFFIGALMILVGESMVLTGGACFLEYFVNCINKNFVQHEIGNGSMTILTTTDRLEFKPYRIDKPFWQVDISYRTYFTTTTGKPTHKPKLRKSQRFKF